MFKPKMYPCQAKQVFKSKLRPILFIPVSDCRAFAKTFYVFWYISNYAKLVQDQI